MDLRKKLLALFLCTVTAVLCFGCTKQEQVDDTKTYLYVEVYNGGFGAEWLDGVKTRFETAYADYEVGDKKGRNSESNQVVVCRSFALRRTCQREQRRIFCRTGEQLL